MTPPGSETLTAYRTVHGIVFARGKVDGKKVAFVIARSTYFHEADSALFFSRMNDPGFMTEGPEVVPAGGEVDELRSSTGPTSTPKHIAYELTGWIPAAGPRHLAGLPDPRHRQVRLEGLRPSQTP